MCCSNFFKNIYFICALIFITGNIPGFASSASFNELQIKITQLNEEKKYSEAEVIAKEVLAMTQKKYSNIDHKDHIKIAKSFKILANIYLMQGRYNEAKVHYGKALSIYQKLQKSRSHDVADIFSKLGQIYKEQGDINEANLFSKRADITRQSLEKEEAFSKRGGFRQNDNFVESTEKFDSVAVYYGTDRVSKTVNQRLYYTSERARRLELGKAVITIPTTGRKKGEITRPREMVVWNYKIYKEKEDPSKHFTIHSLEILDKKDFLKSLRKQLKDSHDFKDHAFLFIHGYNVSFDFALYRTAQMSYDMGFDGVPFLYSWPSKGSLASYFNDLDSSRQSEPHLKKFINMVVNESGAKNIHIIAHSMGNVPLLDTLKNINLTPSARKKGGKINQIILAAPDIDRDVFLNLTKEIKGLGKGITLYASSNDRAMQASYQALKIPRAGYVPKDGPVIASGVDTIDISNISTDILALNHSEYAEKSKLLGDIKKLLHLGLRPPIKRFPSLQRKKIKSGIYWKFIEGN